jgi:hypothetical protein
MNRPLTQTAAPLAPLASAAAAASAGAVADTLKMLCLFALLGLTISAAVLPHVAPDDLAWVFAHLE